MLRFISFVAFVLLILFGGLLSLVRAVPPDDGDVRALIGGDEGCHAPCFMGIEVGVTRSDEAARLLAEHTWVGRVVQTETAVIWRWNGRQPHVINGGQDGLFKVVGGVIRQVRVQTNIRFGDVWLLLAAPDDVLLVRPMSRYSAFQIANYTEAGIQVISTISCPIDPHGFWRAETTLGIGEIWTTEALNGRPFDIYDEAGWWESLRRCSAGGR